VISKGINVCVTPNAFCKLQYQHRFDISAVRKQSVFGLNNLQVRAILVKC
jgi:hypothetical protein